MRSTYVRAALAAIIAILFACTDRRQTREETIPLADTAAQTADATTYWNNEPPLSIEDLERGRHDSTWLRVAASDTTSLRLAPLDTVGLEPLAPSTATRPVEPPASPTLPREIESALERVAADGPSVLQVQVLLDRSPFSPGIVDGKWGKNTRKAVYWMQRAEGLEPTGDVDSLTLARLVELAGDGDGFVRTVRLTETDVDGPYVEIPADIHAQAELDCMCYRSALEEIAERYHAAPELLEILNPGRTLDSLAAGDSLLVPDVEPFELARGERESPDRPAGARDSLGRPSGVRDSLDRPSGVRDSLQRPSSGEVAKIVVSIDGFYLHALDDQGRLLYHFPTTMGSRYQPSPSGQYSVASIAFHPWFHWQPTLFDEVPDTEEDERIPPGPNSPVGVVWIALSKENYGIHGTGEPATIGYSTSHGCVRLTNWDAAFLAERLSPGVPVLFRDLHSDEEPIASAGR